MHSSISNSRMFFLKVLLSLLILSAIYYFLAQFTPIITGAPNQWQDNVIRTQRYFFSVNSPSNIVVGSSKAASLTVGKDSNWVNLGLRAGTSATGLAVVAKKIEKEKDYVPQVIWVEINETCMREIDEDLIEKVSWWHSLPLMCDYERPDYILYAYLHFIKDKIRPARIVDDKNIPSENSIKRIVEAYDERIDTEAYRSVLQSIKVQIDLLRADGVEIILFEPPMASEVEYSKKMLSIRTIDEEVLPDSTYHWERFQWGDYRTSDGTHLQKYSVQKLSDEIIVISHNFLNK